jgi:hypothetical protein
MKAGKTRTALRFTLFACCLTAFAASNVLAKLSPGQARKAITRMPGFELKSSAVRVKSVSTDSNTEAEASAEIRTVFKLAQDEQGRWRVGEIRVGQDRWEEINVIANALKTETGTGSCTAPDPPATGSRAVGPSNKRVRCLLGSLLGVEIPSDAIRIQSVEPMAVPLASQSSATVVAWVSVDAKLLNERTGWHVSELRTGSHNWVKLEPLVAAVNEEKAKTARAQMELMAQALEKYRQERGFYVVSDSQAVAIDHLSPRYLAQVIRVDPWHQPYKYQGDRDRFTLRSAGPDGKADTADDIILNQSP